MANGGKDTWAQIKLNLWKGFLVKKKKPVRKKHLSEKVVNLALM